ncbi:MAG: DNA recombination protein RmuC, partial [Candidatus Aureabacteria bacterium]|nr:DNA recombination protein RmuC [Candidatus Auribacterota bacterium]
SRQRGQCGERMAKDILGLAGFIEGKQYVTQTQAEGELQRPDFTFSLPQGRVLNMDVKFPFDNYLQCVNARTDAERERHKAQFMKDVQNRIKEVKAYINPAAGTLDYALMFIPNEQVYAFVQEEKPDIIDSALREKVILCSPFTLYAILAVIRQAMDNFNLEQKTAQILSLLGTFAAQWGRYVEGMDKLGKKIEEAGKEFDLLLSTRRNMLERPLRKIEELRQEKGIQIAELPPPGDDEALALPEGAPGSAGAQQ